MAKGYWIPHIDVSDPEGYKAYMAATPEAHRKYDGHVLVRGGACEVVEGKGRARNVLREFPDYATALACYRSPEYQRAKPLRLSHSTCDFVIVEGYDGEQPQSSATPPAAARKGYWIAHVDVSPPTNWPSPNTACAISCAAGHARWWKATRAGGPWCSSFRAIRRRTTAIARRSTKPRSRCAKTTRRPISSSSKVMTARSRKQFHLRGSKVRWRRNIRDLTRVTRILYQRSIIQDYASRPGRIIAPGFFRRGSSA
jgi:uncharacterized protein (DUF1330 family)